MPTPTPDPREEKLPRWARDLLQRERHARREAESKLAAHLAVARVSHIWYGGYDNPVFIPPHFGHVRVHFNLSDQPGRGPHRQEMQVGRIEDLDGVRGLEIMAGRPVAVEPQVSNVIKVYFAR